MSVLTYLTEAVVRDSIVEIDGKTLNRPTLMMSDGYVTTYAVDVDIGQEDPLRTVPIANGNLEITYADVGAAVRLRRSESGRFEVIGFSKRLPGTFYAVPVTLPTFEFRPMVKYGHAVVPVSSGGAILGTAEPLGWTSSVIPFGDFPLYNGFGLTPFGAIATYKNGVFAGLTF